MTEYVIGRISPDHWIVAKFAGGEVPEATYTVRRRESGLKCDCPHALYRGGTCKHCEMVRRAEKCSS